MKLVFENACDINDVDLDKNEMKSKKVIEVETDDLLCWKQIHSPDKKLYALELYYVRKYKKSTLETLFIFTDSLDGVESWSEMLRNFFKVKRDNERLYI